MQNIRYVCEEHMSNRGVTVKNSGGVDQYFNHKIDYIVKLKTERPSFQHY